MYTCMPISYALTMGCRSGIITRWSSPSNCGNKLGAYFMVRMMAEPAILEVLSARRKVSGGGSNEDMTSHDMFSSNILTGI